MPPKAGKKSKKDDSVKEATVVAHDEEEEEGNKKGAKSREAKARKAEQAERKAETARLLAAEEASISSKKSASGGSKVSKSSKKDRPSTSLKPEAPARESDEPIESFAATGIDDALDMLSIVNAKEDKASLLQDAAKLDSHPERRFKAAFEGYFEQELPNARKDHPGLRLQQYRDLLYKQFQKHPDNPFNQTPVSYDATKEEKIAVLEGERARVKKRLEEPK